ncbi:hypothetical protein HF086_015183, partial [Spodoptera exigua]
AIPEVINAHETIPESNDKEKNTWQQDRIPKIKRKRMESKSPQIGNLKKKTNTTEYVISTQNQFEILGEVEDKPAIIETEKPPKPEPIFVTGVLDINTLKNLLLRITTEGNFTMTTLRSGHIVKVMPASIEVYKKIREKFITDNISHYTYMLKSERPYRVVVRGLHSSEDTSEIKEALKSHGHEDIITTEIQLKVSLKTCDEIERAIEGLNKLIHDAANRSTSQKSRTAKEHVYPEFIKDCINERRRLRRVWQNTHYPTDKTAFNKASQQLKSLIKELQNENLQSYLANITHTSDTNYSLWKATKNLKRPKQQVTPLRTKTGSWARSDSEKANTYADHLHKVFEPLPSSNLYLDTEVEEYLMSPTQMCLPLKHVTPNELKKEILKLQEGKCPGYDLDPGQSPKAVKSRLQA